MRLAVLAVLALSSPAAADIRGGVHLGGGLEGGLITGEPHPGGLAEAGLSVETLLPGENWGFGLSLESVGRTDSQFSSAEELKIDLTWRFAKPSRKVRAGIGGGVRLLTFGDETASRTVRGIDLTRLDIDIETTSWDLGAARVALDVYFSWTFGCYSDSYAEMPVGDMKPNIVEVGCGSTITTAYVFGLKTTIGSPM